MEKMRVIQLVNGKEIVGLESEFVTSHNTNHNSTIIIHRAKHSQSIIYPSHIAMDTFIDQEAMRIEDEKKIRVLAEKEKKYKKHKFAGSVVFDLPKKKKSKPGRPKKAKRGRPKKKK